MCFSGGSGRVVCSQLYFLMLREHVSFLVVTDWGYKVWNAFVIIGNVYYLLGCSKYNFRVKFFTRPSRPILKNIGRVGLRKIPLYGGIKPSLRSNRFCQSRWTQERVIYEKRVKIWLGGWLCRLFELDSMFLCGFLEKSPTWCLDPPHEPKMLIGTKSLTRLHI